MQGSTPNSHLHEIMLHLDSQKAKSSTLRREWLRKTRDMITQIFCCWAKRKRVHFSDTCSPWLPDCRLFLQAHKQLQLPHDPVVRPEGWCFTEVLLAGLAREVCAYSPSGYKKWDGGVKSLPKTRSTPLSPLPFKHSQPLSLPLSLKRLISQQCSCSLNSPWW